MGRLAPRAFEKCLINGVQRRIVLPDGPQICVAGKRLRRSATLQAQRTAHAQGGASAVYLLHAWCDEAGLCLGQYQTPDKANEITALPDRLVLLDVDGCLLTMNAIGCQRSVTRAITGVGATYLLALKGNQGALQTAVEAASIAVGSAGAATVAGKKPAHGRVETRTCRVLLTTVLSAPLRGPDRVGLQTLVKVVATRTGGTTGITQTETRHYLSSHHGTAAYFQGYVRRHWGIKMRKNHLVQLSFWVNPKAYPDTL